MRLFLLFLIVPLVEIALFVQVGGVIGLWPTLAIVVLTAMLGTWLVRTQGAMELNRLRGTFRDLRDPSEPLAHGAMILLAGALLLTPGFFTDACGFALLVPGIRAAALNYLKSRITVRGFVYGDPSADPRQDPRKRGPGRAVPHPEPHRDRGPVIDGEYFEVDPPKSPTHTPSRGSSGWTRH